MKAHREPQSIPIIRDSDLPLSRPDPRAVAAVDRANPLPSTHVLSANMTLHVDPLPNTHVLSANMAQSRAAIAWVFADRAAEARTADLEEAEAVCRQRPGDADLRAIRDEAIMALARACELEESAHKRMTDAAKRLVEECER